jgi:uncharacterized small protein (DUF1192 family)
MPSKKDWKQFLGSRSKKEWGQFAESRESLYSPNSIPNRIGDLLELIARTKRFQATQDDPEVIAIGQAEIAEAEAEIARLEALKAQGVKFVK